MLPVKIGREECENIKTEQGIANGDCFKSNLRQSPLAGAGAGAGADSEGFFLGVNISCLTTLLEIVLIGVAPSTKSDA